MHRLAIIAASAACLAFTDCEPVVPSIDTDLTEQTQANFWCAFYTSTVVYGQVSHLCRDEINALGEDAAEAWYEQAVRIVLTDCTNYVLNAPESDDVEDVVKHVCRDGYDEGDAGRTQVFEALTCADVTSDDFVVTWPYEELCPCIDDGICEATDDGKLTCSPESAAAQ